MPQNPQYDYDWGPNGPLAPLHDRAAYLDHPSMISPPAGWVPLVLELDKELSHLLPDYTIAQVKEKFSGLRYYIDSFGVGKDDPRIAIAREIIADAEQASQSICQVCGEPGRFRSGFVHATLCDKHAS